MLRGLRAAGLECTIKQCCSTSRPPAVLWWALHTLHDVLQIPTCLMQWTTGAPVLSADKAATHRGGA